MKQKPLVYISRQLKREWLEQLYKYCRVIMNQKRTPPARGEFLRNAATANGVISVLTERVDEELFKTAKNLKIVANYAIGYDNIDLRAAKRHGVFVSNTPGDLAGAVAEHAIALMFALSKRLVEGNKYMCAGRYRYWDPLLFLGNDLRGKTLGIVGVGRIGSKLAKMAAAGLEMEILYYDVVSNKEIEKKYRAKKVSLPILLKNSDFVSVNVPLLPSTRHLISAKEFNLMKRTAYLVNTARGPVVDERALVRALAAKKIAGAGLDVFEFEPRLAPGLAKLPNVVLTPHIASATYSARREMAQIAVENILDVLVRGKKPRNEVKFNG